MGIKKRATSRYLKPNKAELSRYLPENTLGRAGALFSCDFDSDLDVEGMQARLAAMPEITWTSREERKHGPVLAGETPYRQVHFLFRRRRDRWRLEARFRCASRPGA